MSLRIVVTCDSRPAEYARAAGDPCRAWLTTHSTDLVDAMVEALRAGWSYEYSDGDRAAARLTCPACTRAAAALTPTGGTPP